MGVANAEDYEFLAQLRSQLQAYAHQDLDSS